MKKFDFTYTIKQVDIHNGLILVEYKPLQENLTTHTLNVPTYNRKQDDTMFTIEETINEFAPHTIWESQEVLLNANLLNSTGTVTTNT